MTSATAGQPRILVVEDEQVVAMDLERNLLNLGYAVVGVAATGRKAVRFTEEARPDLVLMDIQLKGAVDGIAAADEIRQRWQVPVVFVTANTNDETLARAKAAGPYGYLVKPFRTRELNATILVALHQHSLTRELFAEHTWLTTMLASLSDGVIATDAEGQVRYMNPVAEALTGWTLREALGKAIQEVYPLTTLEKEPVRQCQLRKALAAAAPIGKQRFLARHRDGRMFPVEDAAAPILAGDRVAGAVTVFLDISERLRLEQLQEEERDRLEEQVHVTSEALGHTRAELRALSGHLMTVQEDERRRVARELHDDLAQRAGLAEMELDRLVPLVSGNHHEAQETLRRMRGHLMELSTGLREVSHRLHPSIIADLGLSAALRALADEHREHGGEAGLTVREVPSAIPLDVATALYRIAQEALRNVIKHAREAPVQITLTGKDQGLYMAIEDAGPGFDLDKVREKGGLGLLSMQERARLVGGSLLLRTRPDDGTLIVVRVPLGGQS